MALQNAPMGTMSILDTLAAFNQTVDSLSVETAFKFLEQAFEAHRTIGRLMRQSLMEDTTDKQRLGGLYNTRKMMELAEFGVPPAQKKTVGAPLGFPFRRYGDAVQWGKIALKRMMTQELAADAKSVLDADAQTFLTNMQAAFYRPTNYTWDDPLVNRLSAIPLAVKALANADNFPIPPGPNGEYFDPNTHTHYLVAASTNTLAPADVDALIQTVREHFGTGQGYLAVNSADATTVSAMAKFRAVVDTEVIQPLSGTYVNPALLPLDLVNTNNRMIGKYDGFRVWVKPWSIAAYPVAWWTGNGIVKPLVLRTDPVLPSELTLTYKGEEPNTQADLYERFYGIGVYNRVGMAVLDVNHASYTSPV